MTPRRWVRRFAAGAVHSYGAVVLIVWAAVECLTDRFWPATLVAFGPRFLAAVPIVPLAVALLFVHRRALRAWLAAVLVLTVAILVFGLMDFRLGWHRAPGPPSFRLLTQNLGHSEVTAASLDRLLRQENVDVAALQECPFYDNSPAQRGWHFYYGGDLCLVSRYPFEVLDVADPENFWRRGGREPLRFVIHLPTGSIELLNLHLQTIRGGLESLMAEPWDGLSHLRANRAEAAHDSRSARAGVARMSRPFIVAGDFNLPVESAVYRESWGDLDNAFSRCGRGFGGTKFTRLFAIRIDHVLNSPGWACTDARVAPSPYGGDHAPLIVDLRRVRTN